MTAACCPSDTDSGEPAGGGSSPPSPGSVEGSFTTNGAETVDVPLVDLAADGAWTMLWAFSVGGVTITPGILAYGAILYGQGEAMALRNNAAPPQLFGAEFGAIYPRSTGYVQPAAYAPAGIPASVVLVGNVLTLRVVDGSGFASFAW